MSANNVYVFKNRVYLVSDAAGSVGSVIFSAIDKTILLPRLNAVAGFRGKFSTLNWLRFEMGNFDTVEALLAGITTKLRRRYWLTSKLMPFLGGIELTICGIGSDGKPFAYIITSLKSPSIEPFTPTPIKHGLFAPSLPPANMKEVMGHHASDFDREAVELIQMQRLIPGVIIGCYATVTSVDASGIRQRMLCTWPDKRMKRFDPRSEPKRIIAKQPPSSMISQGWR